MWLDFQKAYDIEMIYRDTTFKNQQVQNWMDEMYSKLTSILDNN